MAILVTMKSEKMVKPRPIKIIMTREVVVSTELFTWMQVNEMKRREEIR